MSFAIELKQPGAVYAWPVIDDTSDAAYSYSIDGAPAGTANVRTNPVMAPTNGTRRFVGFLRFGAVGVGRHVIMFAQTSSGNDGVSVLGIGAISGTAQAKLPVVLVGTVPYQLYPGQAAVACPPTTNRAYPTFRTSGMTLLFWPPMASMCACSIPASSCSPPAPK